MTATLAAAPSQQHPRSSNPLPEPLWGLRLHGVPCSVCERPAAGMTVYRHGRLIHHPGSPACSLPNPPGRVPDYQDGT